MIDHTQLRAYATEIDIRELCEEARNHGFMAVTINSAWTSYCAKTLAGSDVAIEVCVGFPLGAQAASVKVEEARHATKSGATEIGVVINIGALKSGYPKYVKRELEAIIKAVKGVPVKVILENSYLTEAEKAAVCEMSVALGAAYVQTDTGYGKQGATVEDVKLFKGVVGDQLGIKAAGGIRTYGNVITMLEAGASRIGTSAGLEIIEGLPK
jgi:deoxyribose-phosphate aldolase